MTRRAEVRVRAFEAGGSLLEFLCRRFTYQTREEWDAHVRSGRVRLNGAGLAPETRLRPGDRVEFLAPDMSEPPVNGDVRSVYASEDFLVVEKPALLPCHPGGRFFANCLWAILNDQFPGCHIATRLDRETSGLVLVCLTRTAMRHCQRLQDACSLGKEYLAVVHGHFPAEIRACGRLLQDEGSAVRKKRRFVAGIESDCRPSDSSGESCDTLFSLRASCSSDSGPMSLVLARPRTGRTHQIRASLSSLGFPLVGDKLYGLDEGMFLRFAGGRLSDIDRSRLVLEHQALHCSALRFTEIGGAEVALESEPPWEFCDGPGVRFRPPGPPAALPLRSGAEPRSRPVCTP